MPATLNRKKPFDTVYGDDKGRKYFQGGVYFDAQGNEWEDPDVKKPLRRVVQQAKVQPPVPADKQPTLPLEPSAPAPESADDEPAETGEDDDTGELDPAEQLARHMAGGA